MKIQSQSCGQLITLLYLKDVRMSPQTNKIQNNFLNVKSSMTGKKMLNHQCKYKGVHFKK